ncbi:LanC-like protein 2, partial [Leptotrombidium deliense]
TKEEKKGKEKHSIKESSKFSTGKCKGCNGNHARSKCPLLKQKCHSCQKVGHISKVCRLKTKNQASNKLDECEETDLFRMQNLKCDNKFLVDLKVGAEIVNFEVDTGSARTVISEETFESWKQRPKVSPAETTLRTYSGELLRLKGQTSITVTHKNRQRVITLLIAAGNGPNLLGRDALRQFPTILNELTVNYNSESSETLNELLDEFQDVFQEKKEGSNIEVTLEINENATPKFVKARPVPFAMRKKSRKQYALWWRRES